jgi:hypothetical protein
VYINMSKGSTSIGISALTLIYTSEQSYIGSVIENGIQDARW